MVYIDQFFLGDNWINHAMGTVSSYSAVHFVHKTFMIKYITGFQACWLAQLWFLSQIRRDMDFHNEKFRAFVKQNSSFSLDFTPKTPLWKSSLF